MNAPLSPPLEFRTPRPQERSQLLDLWVESWRATFADIDFEARRPWLIEHLAKLEAQGARTIGAFRGGDMLGFVTIDAATGWLDQLSLHPLQFGSGLAQHLLGAAKKLSPHGVQLDVNSDNFRARKFYAKEGFVVVGDGVNPLSGRKTLKLQWTGAA